MLLGYLQSEMYLIISFNGRVLTTQGKLKIATTNALSRKHREIESFTKTQNCVYSRYKFLDSKDQRHCGVCQEIFLYFLRN